MSRAFAWLFAAFAILAAPAHAAESYESLAAKARAGEAGVDFAQLRALYAQSRAYNPYGTVITAATAAMRKAAAEDNCAETMKAAALVFQANPADIEAHYAAALCHKGHGDPARALYHEAAFKQLLAALLASGDGKSPQTAIKVISPGEEFFALSMLGLEPKDQALVQTDGKLYDLFTVVSEKTGEKSEIFFDVSLPTATLRKGS
jgi:hypothetical protein